MVSESSEGRALPQNVSGRYDASEERHLARLVTKGRVQVGYNGQSVKDFNSSECIIYVHRIIFPN